MNLSVDPHSEPGMYIIKASDEIIQMLEEHIVQLYSMKGSKYELVLGQLIIISNIKYYMSVSDSFLYS